MLSVADRNVVPHLVCGEISLSDYFCDNLVVVLLSKVFIILVSYKNYLYFFRTSMRTRSSKSTVPKQGGVPEENKMFHFRARLPGVGVRSSGGKITRASVGSDVDGSCCADGEHCNSRYIHS